jgi:Na+/proline symporter
MSTKDHSCCTLIDRFSWKEKLLMRTGWFGFMAVGAYAIARQNPLWAWAYVALGVFGFTLVVLPNICARCPYPSQFSTCLFLPPGLMKRFYPYKETKMSLSGKIATLLAMAGMVIMPQFWLVHNLPLFALFWLIGLPVLTAFPFYYCSRCRNFSCPMNKAQKA